MKSIESSGKTVEDAVRAGLQQLGCDAADVTIDVLEAGRPGLFGMFGKLAKVRLTLKENEADMLRRAFTALQYGLSPANYIL